MSPRWRNFSFVVLAIVIVIGIDQLVMKVDIHQHQNQAKKPDRTSAVTRTKPGRNNPSETAHLIPLYPAGDLFAENPPKPKTSKKTRKKTEKKKVITPKKPVKIPRKPTVVAKKGSKDNKTARKPSRNPSLSASKKLKGERPVLEVAYSEIGFRRYLDIIERVGRLFILLDTESGVRLGPEISLRDGNLFPGKPDMSVLADKRPHLVSDERIQERLEAIDIPENAHDDKIVLILTKPFDDLLWSSIISELKSRGLEIHQITQIIGNYTHENGRVLLRLDSVVIEGSGKKVPLGRKILVAL